MDLLYIPILSSVLIDNKKATEISSKEIAEFRGGKLVFGFQNYNLIPRLTVI
jgi:ABC-type lipoprotein export system ATPase subunit